MQAGGTVNRAQLDGRDVEPQRSQPQCVLADVKAAQLLIENFVNSFLAGLPLVRDPAMPYQFAQCNN